jgi:tetratricopeptide (TPR) repeat protein
MDTKMDSDKLLRIAEEKMDENAFAEARDIYRKVFLESSPSPKDLANLDIAEDWEIILHRHELCERYPDSENAKSSLAYKYLRILRPQQALDIYSNLVDSQKDAQSRFNMLYIRFRSALSAGRYNSAAYDMAAGDFVELWLAGDKNESSIFKRLRSKLLRDVSALADFKAVRILDILEQRLSGEVAVLEYVAIKRREWEFLSKFI